MPSGSTIFRKNDVRGLVQHPRQIAPQEIVELEETQKAEVRAQAQDQHRFPPRPWGDLLQPDAGRVIDRGQSQQQRNESVIPASVKEITGRQQNILAQGARAGVEQRQHHGQEQKEMCGVEQHGFKSSGGPLIRRA